MKQRFSLNTDARASFVVFFSLILFQFIYVLIQKDFTYLFGVEYGNIAHNLISGKGFSNPLPPSDTGPTAWVPPIFVFIISGGFLLFGQTIGAFIFLSLIKFITYAFIFYFLLKTLRLVEIKINYSLLILIYLFYFLFSPRDNFESIHDFWIPQLLVILFIYYSIRLYYSDKKHIKFLYIIIFLSPLINPGYALAFMVVLGFITLIIPVTKAIYARNKDALIQTTKKGFVKILTFCLVFIFSIFIWSVRNYMVFNKFIPIKSNMWFEFYLANIVDSDGKLSQSALYKAHPIYNESLRQEMLNQGEINWLEKYNIKSHEYLKNNMGDYFQKVRNRLILAFIFTETDNDNIRSENFSRFSESDKFKLTENKLIVRQDWTTGFYSDEKMLDYFNKLNIQEKEFILADWKTAKSKFEKHKYALPDIVRGAFMGIIPSVCVLALLLFRETRRNPLFLISVTLYLLYMVPYILISHQIRYQRPLFLLQVILVYLISIFIIQKLFPVLKNTFVKIK
jgi:hypothetical protein